MTPDFEKEARDFCNKGPISVETLADRFSEIYNEAYWAGRGDAEYGDKEEHF